MVSKPQNRRTLIKIQAADWRLIWGGAGKAELAAKPCRYLQVAADLRAV